MNCQMKPFELYILVVLFIVQNNSKVVIIFEFVHEV